MEGDYRKRLDYLYTIAYHQHQGTHSSRLCLNKYYVTQFQYEVEVSDNTCGLSTTQTLFLSNNENLSKVMGNSKDIQIFLCAERSRNLLDSYILG